MKLQQLRYFVAVYEVGSITGGAERAHATQSGLSMQIKDLEYQLKGSLFKRSASGVTPTPMGNQFYTHATQILRSVEEAKQAMRAAGQKLTGTIRAGLIPTLTRSILPSTLISMSTDYPLVETKILEAYSDQLTQDVAQNILDFAIVPAPATGEELRTRNEYLGTDQEFLVSAADQSTQHMQPINLTEGGPYKLVLPGAANARRDRINAYIQTHNIKIAQILELDSMLGTLELVAASDWKTILPGLVCQSDKQGDIRKLNPIIGSPLHVDYVIIEPKSSSLSNESKIFANLLKQELNNQINWFKD